MPRREASNFQNFFFGRPARATRQEAGDRRGGPHDAGDDVSHPAGRRGLPGAGPRLPGQAPAPPPDTLPGQATGVTRPRSHARTR